MDVIDFAKIGPAVGDLFPDVSLPDQHGRVIRDYYRSGTPYAYGQPIPSGYIPLSVAVAPIAGLEVGAPEFPLPRPYRIEGLDEEFVVYEKTVTVALPLTFTRQEGEDQTLQVTVRCQACSATDCLAPRIVQLQIPVKVADLTEWPRRK